MAAACRASPVDVHAVRHAGWWSSVFTTCLFEDRAGTLWIGTEGGGVNAFSQGRFASYTTDGKGDHNIHVINVHGNRLELGTALTSISIVISARGPHGRMEWPSSRLETANGSEMADGASREECSRF